MDPVDLAHVTHQLGTAVLKASTGALVQATGEMEGPDGAEAAATLYKILLDAGNLLDQDPLRRITVSYRTFQYVVAISGGSVYIMKKTPDD